MKSTKTHQRTREREDDDLPGYPEYARENDIYANAEQEEEIDPENIHSRKKAVAAYRNRRDEEDDLDIPGSESDDEQEEIGSEDEENNFYSLSDNDDLEDLI
ncbi:MAG TPA: hypothetical protein VK155_04750 [Bacteroidales bacterium]|jgi:hypothetical protein|nr:hypothetical protein [Bacteroidales bacterium]